MKVLALLLTKNVNKSAGKMSQTVFLIDLLKKLYSCIVIKDIFSTNLWIIV